MLKKSITMLAMICLAGVASADLYINEILTNPVGGSDAAQGLEYIEIKNTGGASVDLGAGHYAIICIENESGQHGEIDAILPLSGTIPANGTYTLRDLKSDGTLPTINPHAGSVESYQFTTDLPNSGSNYILVSGYNSAATNPTTGQPWTANDLMDSGAASGSTANDLIFDFKQSGTTSDDMWSTAVDAVAYSPGTDVGGGVDDYTANLSLGAGHRIVCGRKTNWTPDIFFRLFRTVSGVNIYDQGLVADVQAYSNNQIMLVDPATSNESGMATTTANEDFSPLSTGANTIFASPGAVGQFSITFNSTTYNH